MKLIFHRKNPTLIRLIIKKNREIDFTGKKFNFLLQLVKLISRKKTYIDSFNFQKKIREIDFTEKKILF